MTTVKKWYFSKDGETKGPFDFEKAQAYVKDHNDHYGWHPSYRSWRPVSMIAEFEGLVDLEDNLSKVPEALITDFHDRSGSLKEKLKDIRKSIGYTESLKAKLKQKITLYKNMTSDLNDDVKAAIDDIEKKYKSIGNKLEKLVNAADVAEEEIQETETQFKQQLDARESGEAPKNKATRAKNIGSAKSKISSEIKISKVSADIQETKEAELALHALDSLVDEEPEEEIETIEILDETLLESGGEQSLADLEKALVEQTAPSTKSTKKVENIHRLKPETNKNTSDEVLNSVEEQTGDSPKSNSKSKEEKKKLGAVTGMFKSVFKTESATPKMSAALSELSEPEDADKEVAAVITTSDDSPAQRPRRRRRRR